MANRRTYIIAAAAAAFSYQALKPEEAKAISVATWNFEVNAPPVYTSPTTGTNPATWVRPTVGPIAADAGVGSLYGIHTVNSNWTTPVGNASPTSYSALGWSVGNSYWEFKLDLTLYEDITMSFDQLSSSTGPRNWSIQYKVGSGGSYTNIADYSLGYNSTGGAISWSSTIPQPLSNISFNLSSISAIEKTNDVFIRLLVRNSQVYGTSTVPLGTNGTSRIDNVQVTAAVPEPGTAVVLAAGAAIAAARKRKRK
jgi:hypothetical protein